MRPRRKGIALYTGRTLRLVASLGALAALTVAGASATAGASPAPSAKATVISMERDGRDLSFDGPKTVEAGTKLKLKNNSNPRQIGPHTFSLAHKKDFPKGRAAIKGCAKELKGICGAIVKWHDVDVETGAIGENPVDVGKDGWNIEGSLKRKGDSWVSEKKGQTFAREVTARPGKTLHFICAVHPEMQGKIKVVEG